MSATERLIDQYIFGHRAPKLTSALGLYLSPDVIYIAETKAGADGRPVVEHLVRIPIPADTKASTTGATLAMNTDFLTDPSKMAGLIKQAMAQSKWGSKNVIVTLSHHLGLLRYFPMPPIERRFLKTAVPVEAKKYIPIPFDALSYDYYAAPMNADSAGKPRLGVLISVTQKKNVANLNGLLNALGFKLAGVEVAPCSVLRLWQAVDRSSAGAPFAQVHFDGGNVRTLVCDRDMPVFFRETFLGGEPTLADLRKVDLSGCLAFAQKQLALPPVAKVKLSGNPAALGPWRDAFAKESGTAVEIQDTAKLLSIKGGDWGGYAAIGASARALQGEQAGQLDLSSTERVGDDERQTARDILVGGAAVAALVALIGGWNHLSYNRQAAVLKTYQIDPEVEAQLKGLGKADIEMQLREMRDQASELAPVSSQDRPKLSQIIHELVTLMPPSVWIDRISILDPIAGEQSRTYIEITGRCRADTASQEQDLALRFQALLRSSELLGKRFDVNVAFQAGMATGSEGSLAGLSPEALQERLENRTTFNLRMQGKK